MLKTLEPRDWLLFGALAIGVAFGAVGRLSGFCFRPALVELLERQPGRQVAAGWRRWQWPSPARRRWPSAVWSTLPRASTSAAR